MNKDEIKEIELKMKAVEEFKKKCKHNWLPTKSIIEEYEDSEIDHWCGNGDDSIPIYKDVTKKRQVWTRECKTCGSKERTTEQREIKTYEPHFYSDKY